MDILNFDDVLFGTSHFEQLNYETIWFFDQTLPVWEEDELVVNIKTGPEDFREGGEYESENMTDEHKFKCEAFYFEIQYYKELSFDVD